MLTEDMLMIDLDHVYLLMLACHFSQQLNFSFESCP